MNTRTVRALPLLGLCCLCLLPCAACDRHATSTTHTTSGSVSVSARDEAGRPGARSAFAPGDQGRADADLALASRVRQAIADDRSLSLEAQNARVSVVNGMVTLRGAAKDENERWRIASTAAAIAGANHVDDQIGIEAANEEIP